MNINQKQEEEIGFCFGCTVQRLLIHQLSGTNITAFKIAGPAVSGCFPSQDGRSSFILNSVCMWFMRTAQLTSNMSNLWATHLITRVCFLPVVMVDGELKFTSDVWRLWWPLQYTVGRSLSQVFGLTCLCGRLLCASCWVIRTVPFVVPLGVSTFKDHLQFSAQVILRAPG